MNYDMVPDQFKDENDLRIIDAFTLLTNIPYITNIMWMMANAENMRII